MATESVKLVIEAESQVEAETAKAQAELKKVEAAVDAETLALKRYKIAVEEGAEALDVFNLQLKGIDEQTAKTIAAERALIREMERVKKEAEKPVKTPEGVSAGKGTKTASDLVKTLASLTGSSEIASFAGGLGELSEKTEQFAEAGKKGGAGALALKGGLIAAVGAIAFSAGKFLGDMIFQTEKWNKELENGKQRANELAAEASKLRSLRFADTTADIELIRDPEGKREAYQRLLDDLKKNVAGVSNQVKQSQKDVEEWEAAWQITGNRKAYAEMAQQQLELDKERLQQLKEQQTQIERLLTVEAERARIAEENAAMNRSEEYLQSLREELKLLQATGSERANLEAERGGAFGADVGEAAMLLEQIEAQKALLDAEREAESERKRIADESAKSAQRIAELKDKELEKLEIERIALLKGKEAADAFALAKQGLNQADAEAIAKARAENEEIKRRQVEQEQATKARDNALLSPLQVQTTRFLTRGPVDDKTSRLVDLSKQQADVQKQQLAVLNDIRDRGRSQDAKPTLKFEAVG